jgi:hypothetical protein
MVTIKRFEQYNAQDMMTIPTMVTKNINNVSETDPLTKYSNKLLPYYNQVRTLIDIKDISQITKEQIDKYIGFSFTLYFTRIFIVTDMNKNYILINKNLIPLENPNEIKKIIEGELD